MADGLTDQILEVESDEAHEAEDARDTQDLSHPHEHLVLGPAVKCVGAGQAVPLLKHQVHERCDVQQHGDGGRKVYPEVDAGKVALPYQARHRQLNAEEHLPACTPHMTPLSVHLAHALAAASGSIQNPNGSEGAGPAPTA